MTHARFPFILLSLVAFLGCEPRAKPAEVSDASITAPQNDVGSPAVAEELAPSDAGRAMAQIDAQIAFHHKQAAKQKGSLSFARVAELHLSRVQLSGRIDDYVAAEEALQRAFERALEGSGPFLTRAAFNVAVHRIDEVEPELARYQKQIIKTPEEEAFVAGLRADVASQKGDWSTAKAILDRLEGEKSTLGNAARLAAMALEQERYDEAAQLYETAVKRAIGDPEEAWALTHRGTVDFERGEWERALEWFARSEELFSGWYLNDYYRGRALAELGRHDEALPLLRSVAARTPVGQHYVALADVLESKGDLEAAREAREKARQAFERDIARIESAVLPHAVGFFLETDSRRGLELDRRYWEILPSDASRATLAQALVAVGKTDEATKILEAKVP